VTGAAPAAAIRRRIRIPLRFADDYPTTAYLATKARRGRHDLLSQSLERAAEPHRHAGPAHLGIVDR
jgi:hypothetical protein